MDCEEDIRANPLPPLDIELDEVNLVAIGTIVQINLACWQ